MNAREKQKLISDLRKLRDELNALNEAGTSTAPDWQLLRKYTETGIKAVVTLDSALITLST